MLMNVYRCTIITYGGYTGEGKPPRIVMQFIPDSDDTTPPDLKMITSLVGEIKESKLLQIDRVVEFIK